jgi:restriction endonuclease S subunit
MSQFDLAKISQIDIPIVSDNIKESVCEYIKITNNLISDNNERIINTLKLKSCLMNSISLDKMIQLDKIAQLYDKKYSPDTKLTNKMIGVIRNGLSAGHVNLVNTNEIISNNSHYITITNINYLLEFIYHWFKHNEIKLNELSNLNPQPNLSQSNLLNFKIPDLSMESQIEIVNHCNDFDSIINKYKANNKSLVDKDIMGTILKINVLS